MRTLFRAIVPPKFAFSVALLLLFFAARSATAAQFRQAQVTQIVKEVQLLPGQATPRSATINERVGSGTAVRTGTDSRAELTFTDQTLARLGANTLFNFNEGTRNLDLGGGAMLLRVPKGAGGAKVTTAAVTAAITGTTVLLEYHRNAYIKLISLEGTARMYLNKRLGESVLIRPGQMLIVKPDAKTLPDPVDVDLKRLAKTCLLITGFPPLASETLIDQEIQNQENNPDLIPTNLVIFGGGTVVTLVDPTSLEAIDQSVAAITSTSGKFGPPSAITAPNPYHITSGTQINTDPTITTNGVTNSGKIYRSAAQDGPLPTWLGATPSAFDDVILFNDTDGFKFPDSKALPLAGFLFSGLQLDGDPTVSDPNGVKILGFFSQGGITSSASGTGFTFGGVNEVALVALNGSINLSGISFANFGRLFVYARGPGSNLTLGAPISNLNNVTLRAEGDVQVNAAVTTNQNFKALAGNNLVASSTVNTNSLVLQSLGSINITSSAQLLAVLDAAGNSGQIVIIASGSDTNLSVSGVVQADQGEVDIRHTGVAGITSLNKAVLRGDVVKVSALGTNGALNIGNGSSINANTVIKLYAPGSNGTLNFLSNVTLTSPSNILAANTINIGPGIVVTINSANMADVFTNNPNYFGFGGNGSAGASGTFGGAGAKNPQPLANAPPLGPPGGGP